MVGKNLFSSVPVEIIDHVFFKYMDVPSLVAWSMTSRVHHDLANPYLYSTPIGRHRIQNHCRDRRLEKENFFSKVLSRIPSSELQTIGVAGLYLWMHDAFYSTNRLRALLTTASLVNERMTKICRAQQQEKEEEEWSWHHARIYDHCMEELDYDHHDLCRRLKKKYNLLVK